MPKIYELLGYPASDVSPAVQESRKRAFCPFISDTCDGGGNRYMSDIDLQSHPELAKLFPGKYRVPSGVCSIQLSEEQSPWIICPRRLLYLGRKANEDVLHGITQTKLLEKSAFPHDSEIGIWSEAKVKYSSGDDAEDTSAFDYTFDYVLMPLGRVSRQQAIEATGTKWNELQKNLRESGHTFSMRDSEIYIEDFPVNQPVIVEVMTSSTIYISGGEGEI